MIKTYEISYLDRNGYWLKYWQYDSDALGSKYFFLLVSYFHIYRGHFRNLGGFQIEPINSYSRPHPIRYLQGHIK